MFHICPLFVLQTFFVLRLSVFFILRKIPILKKPCQKENIDGSVSFPDIFTPFPAQRCQEILTLSGQTQKTGGINLNGGSGNIVAERE